MNRVKIGWGKKEFSFNAPVNINGQMYKRRCYGIHDPLYATALCIDGGEGNDVVIFCCLDVTVLRGRVMYDTIDNIRKLRPDIPADNIIINATHTHSSMDYSTDATHFADGVEIYSQKKVQVNIVAKATEAICEAFDNRAEGGISFGYGYAVVAHSRRSTYGIDMSEKNPNVMAPNGHSIMYGNTNDEDFWGYEAGADHFLNAAYTYDKDNKLTGIIVNVPCPSQLSEHFRQLSADYWCEVKEGVKEAFGEDVFVLTQCAAAGDLSPRILHYKKAQARRFRLKYGDPTDYDGKIVPTESEYIKVMGERRDIGERVVAGLKEIYSWCNKDIRTEFPVRHTVKTLDLKRRLITDEEAEWCRNNIENMKNAIPERGEENEREYCIAVDRYHSCKGRNERALGRYEAQVENPTIPSIIHCVQIGDIAFTTNRFELYMDYMHRIQARSPFIQTFVVQLAGDEGGSYLPTVRGVWGKGYSASLFCNQVGPEGGQQIVEESLKILEEMKAKDEE